MPRRGDTSRRSSVRLHPRVDCTAMRRTSNLGIFGQSAAKTREERVRTNERGCGTNVVLCNQGSPPLNEIELNYVQISVLFLLRRPCVKDVCANYNVSAGAIRDCERVAVVKQMNCAVCRDRQKGPEEGVQEACGQTERGTAVQAGSRETFARFARCRYLFRWARNPCSTFAA